MSRFGATSVLALTIPVAVAQAQPTEREILQQAFPLCFELYTDEQTIEHKTCLEVVARHVHSKFDREQLTSAVNQQIREREAERTRARRAEAARERESARRRDERSKTLAQKPLGVIVERWWLGGFGTVFLANVTLQNNSEKRMADFRIACQTYGNSGTALSSASGVLYEALAPKQRRTFEVNLGAVNSQSARVNCAVTPGKT